MIMTPQVRKFALTAHIVSSVGWLGAVLAFLGPAIAGMTSRDIEIARSSYLTMDLIGRSVLVPLSVASLITGLIQGLGTRWGLFRHYWVIAKLTINLFATVVLLLFAETLRNLSDVAAKSQLSATDLILLRSPSAVIHSAGAFVLLVVATVLSIYKPRGLTAHGRRKLPIRPVAAQAG